MYGVVDTNDTRSAKKPLSLAFVRVSKRGQNSVMG